MRILPRLRRPLLLASLLGLAACARAAAPERDTSPAAWSLYDLGSTWRDQDGAPRTLAALRGRPRVIAMVYTHCAATCPITVAEMKRIAALTPASVGLVLVSLDPARDTPGRLADYAASLGLPPERWTLLNGSDDAVRELAASIGVRYRRASADELSHSNVLTLVDDAGVIVRQQQGLEGTDETIRAARALAR